MRCSSGTQAVTGGGVALAADGASAAATFRGWLDWAGALAGAASLEGAALAGAAALAGPTRIGRLADRVAVLPSPTPTAMSGTRKAGPARGMMAETRPPGTRDVKLTRPLPRC